MEPYIRISNINDYLYSPRSLYLHSVYETFSGGQYKAVPQINGTLLHTSIDQGTYSSAKRYITGLAVYSERFGIAGKIDIYDRETKALIERKARIKKIHDGYILQLHAQYFALCEGGYDVEKLCLHSLEDNKRYEVPLPDADTTLHLEGVLASMRAYDIQTDKEDNHSLARCEESIYGSLSY